VAFSGDNRKETRIAEAGARKDRGFHPCSLPNLILTPVKALGARRSALGALARLHLLHSVWLLGSSAKGLKGCGLSAVRLVSSLEGCGAGQAGVDVFHGFFASRSEGGES
jgi:hypothetical protein